MPTREENSNRENIRLQQRKIEQEFEKVITNLFSKSVRLRMIQDRFRLSDNVSFEKYMEEVLSNFKLNVEAIIVSGITESMELSKRNFLEAILGKYEGLSFSDAWLKVLDDGYNQVLEQFLKRVEGGLSLSDRVWKITNQLQRDIEYTIFTNLADGKGAQQMSRDLRQYLKNPNALFRRVRNAKGKLVLSKAARKYKPGQGVYRSAYKNAMRVSRVEINTAYRTADHVQYKNTPFVLGIEIRLSDAHPTYDMCDELVGVYPSWFKFTGFHIQCICYQVPILAPREEFEAYQLALLDGKPFTFSNRVTKVPPQAFRWVKDNADALSRWKSKPTFMQDNLSVFGGG